MSSRFYLIVVFISTIFSLSCHAKSSQRALDSIDRYLFQIKSIETEFIQSDSAGNIRKGRAYIKKPNQIRVEYYSPEIEIIILDSDLIMYYNRDLEETNYLARENFVLDILSQKNFKLIKQAEIHQFKEGTNEIELSFSMVKDKASVISLIFFKDPLKLKSMKINQSNDIMTLNFMNLETNLELDDYLFDFTNTRIF